MKRMDNLESLLENFNNSVEQFNSKIENSNQDNKKTELSYKTTLQTHNKSLKNVVTKKKTKKKTLISLVPVFSILILTYGYTNMRTMTVTGKVFENNDEKTQLTNVSITVDNEQIVENEEDSSNFTIKNLKEGYHNISFKKKGYKPFKEYIEVKHGENVSLDVKLSKLSLNSKGEVLNFPEFVALSEDSGNVSLIGSNDNKALIQNSSIKDISILAEKNKLYASNYYDNSISIIDYNNPQNTKKINLGTGVNPSKMVFSNNKNQLFIKAENNNFVSIIDTNTETVAQNNFKLDVNEHVKDIMVNPANNKLMAITGNNLSQGINDNLKLTNFTGNKTELYNHFVFMLNPETREVIKVDLYSGKETRIPLQDSPTDITISKKSGAVYVSSMKTITEINPETDTIIKTNQLNINNISSLEVSETDNNIYLTGKNDSNVYIFDTSKSSLLKEKINTGFPVQKIIFLKS